MREIKFKGLLKGFNKKWVYGLLIHNGKGRFQIYDIKEEQFFQVHEESVALFTGLLDKQGQEIYEGDIVKIDTDIAVIIFEEGSFKAHVNNSQIKTSACFWRAILERYEFEVIGNKYQNPELLEVKNER